MGNMMGKSEGAMSAHVRLRKLLTLGQERDSRRAGGCRWHVHSVVRGRALRCRKREANMLVSLVV